MIINQFIHVALLLSSIGSSMVVEDQRIFPSTSGKTLDNIRDTLKKAKIISEVLDDFKPSCNIQILYPQEHKKVHMGNEINPAYTTKAPVLHIKCLQGAFVEGAQFTIALTDPDAPSRDNPKWSEICHWIAKVPENQVGGLGDSNNILQNPVALGIQGLGEVIDYKPPGPPKMTGSHRYVFVLLVGDNSNLTVPSDRKHWGTGKVRHGVRDWAKQESLEIVGANFFYAQNKKQ